MLAKFSVKKPYTVVVAIVLVILLGAVSLTKMSTDLLPNMNMPYAIVMTSYPGASPEQVEQSVTQPIEAAMATTSNIKDVNSVSAENYSMVILEFEQTANMDSVTVEMRESLDQIGDIWPDEVGNPIIMKINPDMMPIMVAAMGVDGMDTLELSRHMEEDLIPALESVEGVASVSSVGGAEESVQVILNQDKIDEINEKIVKSLDEKFEDAQKAMNSAKGELDSGKQQIASGQNEMTGQISGAQSELNQKRLELFQTENDLNQKLAEAKEAKKTLKDSIKTMKEQKEGLSALQSSYAALGALLPLKDSVDDAIFQAQAHMTKQEFEENYNTVKKNYDEIKASLKLDSDATDEQVNKAFSKSLTELQTNLSSLNASIKTLQTALENVEEGKNSIDEAMATLNASEVAGIIQMAEASAGISSGEAQLQQQQKEFEESKEAAYDEADLDQILTMDTLTGILTAQNFSMPAGYITEDGTQYLVRVGDAIDSVDALKGLVLMDLGMEGVDVIHLEDVADIVVTDNSADSYARIDGKPGIMLTLEKQTGYSTGDVTDRVYERMDELEQEDSNLHTTVFMDQGIYIDMIVRSVFTNMILGGILAILILIFFLKDVRPTLVIACSIPVSVVFAVVLMYFSGVTLNMISLSGLALGIGMLVDNSIVVIENIYRMRSEGASAKEAAVAGTRQVAGAIIASTLTTVSVFAPIIFTEGITRQLFVDMGLTIAYALLASLLIALTFVPMMASGVLSRTKEIKHPWMEKVQEAYGSFLGKLLHCRILAILVMAVLLAISVRAALSRGTAFLPPMESTQMSVTIEPNNDAEFSELTKIADEVTEKILTIEDVETVGAMAGGGGSAMSFLGSGSDDTASLYLVLKEDKELTNSEIAKKIRELTKGIDATLSISESEMDLSMLGSGLSIEVKGRKIEKLQSIAKDIAKIVEGVEGTTEVSDGMEETTPELRITVDKEKAAEYGMTVAQVYQMVQEKMADETSDATISTDIQDYEVYLIGKEARDVTLDAIRNMTFSYTNKENNEKEDVPLSKIVKFEEQDGLSSISRDNQERYLEVTAQIADGYNIGLVGNEVQKAIDAYDLPNGYSLEMTGEDEMITEAMEQLLLMLLLGTAFIYLIMVAQFQSLRAPFIILFTIPLALTGGFGALYLTGNEVSIMAMIGFVMLVGIIVNNGIVMVDYINQLRRSGMEKRDAIIEAGKTRMRPILMTALTTIFAMLAMAFSNDMGADMSRPMAIVTIGGMVYGTLMTLLIVPCIYDLFYGKKELKE